MKVVVNQAVMDSFVQFRLLGGLTFFCCDDWMMIPIDELCPQAVRHSETMRCLDVDEETTASDFITSCSISI